MALILSDSSWDGCKELTVKRPLKQKLFDASRLTYCFFTDINECDKGSLDDWSHDCHSDATCNNTGGSFSCHCLNGYSGDGRVCSGYITNYMYNSLLIKTKIMHAKYFNLPIVAKNNLTISHSHTLKHLVNIPE